MTGAPKGTGSLAGSTASSRAPRLRKPGKWRRPWPQRRTSRRAGQPSAGTARTRRAQARPDVSAVPPGTTDIGGGAKPRRSPKLKTRTPPQNGRDNGKPEHLIAAPHPQPAHTCSRPKPGPHVRVHHPVDGNEPRGWQTAHQGKASGEENQETLPSTQGRTAPKVKPVQPGTEQLEPERKKASTPEPGEYRRLHAQAQRRQAKEKGLCVTCGKPAIPDQTRCETCAERHRVNRRRWQAARRNKPKELNI